MESMSGEEVGVIHALIPNDELDQSIQESGRMPSDSLPIESMRLVAADVVMAVGSAIAMADPDEFLGAIRSLKAPASIPARDFAEHFLAHLLSSLGGMPHASAMDLVEIEPRFELIRGRVSGKLVDGTTTAQ